MDNVYTEGINTRLFFLLVLWSFGFFFSFGGKGILITAFSRIEGTVFGLDDYCTCVLRVYRVPVTFPILSP